MIALSSPMYYAMLYAHWAIFISAPIALFRAGWASDGRAYYAAIYFDANRWSGLVYGL
jgi:hypothetical protein